MTEPLICEDCQTTDKVKTVYLFLTKEGLKDLCPKCRDKREAPHISGRSRRAD